MNPTGNGNDILKDLENKGILPELNSANEISACETSQYLTNIIGCKLHDYREASGLSLRDINRPTKISMTVISDLENGKKMPKFETFLRLMRIVGMPYTEVFNADILPQKTPKSASAIRVGLIQDKDDVLRGILLSHNFTYKEIEDIFLYMEFIKSKRK